MSGLHVNWRKSFLYPVNEVPNMEILKSILGGEVAALPTTYLDMPLWAKSKSIEIWNGVIEKCEKKTARLTLINSVLDALPTYMMSLFPVPIGIINRLDNIRRKFLWQGNKEIKGYHLVKWKTMIKDKRELESGSWMTKEVTTPYDVSLWKSIRLLWNDFKSNTKIKVVDGRHETGNVEKLFPGIYCLVSQQESTIAELWTPPGWNFVFRRHLNDWEIPRVTEFFGIIEHFSGLETGLDRLQRLGNNKRTFKVSAAYRKLNHPYLQVPKWLQKHNWKGKIPHKVACFEWLLAKEAVLTQEDLMKRGIPLCSRFFFGGKTAETVNNFVFLRLKNISWSVPGRISEALYIWEEAGLQAKNRSNWRIIPATIWWTIWKERILRVFESRESNMQQIKLNCILTLWFWCNQIYSNDTVSIIDVLDSF
ncbi:unnamed protein product [Withania somnifera]